MLKFKEYGNKENPTVILLHGAGVLHTFSHQLELASRYHLVIPELPGAGDLAGRLFDPEWTDNALLDLVRRLGGEPVILAGHSLGAQIALRFALRHPELTVKAAILSAWINPRTRSVHRYIALARPAASLLHCAWLVRLQGMYWRLSHDETGDLVSQSKRITPAVYASFFRNTLQLRDYPEYRDLRIPILAVCGSRETRDMKRSLAMLQENPHCRTLVLSGAGHDYPLRFPERLNPLLESFFEECLMLPLTDARTTS